MSGFVGKPGPTRGLGLQRFSRRDYPGLGWAAQRQMRLDLGEPVPLQHLLQLFRREEPKITIFFKAEKAGDLVEHVSRSG